MLKQTKTNGVDSSPSRAALRVRAYLSHQSSQLQALAHSHFCTLSQRFTYAADYARFRVHHFCHFCHPQKFVRPADWMGLAALAAATLTRKEFKAMPWDKRAVKLTEVDRKRDVRWNEWTTKITLKRFAKRLRSIGITDTPTFTIHKKDGYTFTWQSAEGARGKMYVSWYCDGCRDIYDSHEVKNVRDMGNFILDVRKFNCKDKFYKKVKGLWAEEVQRLKDGARTDGLYQYSPVNPKTKPSVDSSTDKIIWPTPTHQEYGFRRDLLQKNDKQLPSPIGAPRRCRSSIIL